VAAGEEELQMMVADLGDLVVVGSVAVAQVEIGSYVQMVAV